MLMQDMPNPVININKLAELKCQNNRQSDI